MLDFKSLIKKYRYPLLVLIIGIILFSFPKQDNAEKGRADPLPQIQSILSSVEGVGKTAVLISDNGAVIVCEGADKASVRLDILHAVQSYTGLRTDKICILKMRD